MHAHTMTTCQLQTVKVYETYIEGPGGREFCIPICRAIGPIFELETAVSLLLLIASCVARARPSSRITQV